MMSSEFHTSLSAYAGDCRVCIPRPHTLPPSTICTPSKQFKHIQLATDSQCRCMGIMPRHCRCRSARTNGSGAVLGFRGVGGEGGHCLCAVLSRLSCTTRTFQRHVSPRLHTESFESTGGEGIYPLVGFFARVQPRSDKPRFWTCNFEMKYASSVV